MTIGQKSAPQHGGYTRVAINGGANSGKRQLSFQAASVNIDNWSPYWYKLEPVEEYIPPFQHDVSISLPLVNTFELVCTPPPGLPQADIVSSTLIPGNFQPIIAIFSSYSVNNDAGFNALDSAANISQEVAFTNVPLGQTILTTIDLTNYNGIYFWVFPQGTVEIAFAYEQNGGFPIFYKRTFYQFEQFLFTIPKISKHIRITAVNNGVGTVQVPWSIRPFLGSVDSFFAEQLVDAGFPQHGELSTLTGNGVVDFGCYGISNAVITVLPRNAGGIDRNTAFWVRVFITDYGVSAFRPEIYSRAFIWGEGTVPLVIPLTGILQRQNSNVRVNLVTTLGTTVTDIAFHHNFDDAAIAGVTDPSPVTQQASIGAVSGGAFTLVMTIPVGGVLDKLIVTNVSVSANAQGIFYVGGPTTQDIVIGAIACTNNNTFVFDNLGIQLYNGFSHIWVQLTGGVIVGFSVQAVVR